MLWPSTYIQQHLSIIFLNQNETECTILKNIRSTGVVRRVRKVWRFATLVMKTQLSFEKATDRGQLNKIYFSLYSTEIWGSASKTLDETRDYYDGYVDGS